MNHFYSILFCVSLSLCNISAAIIDHDKITVIGTGYVGLTIGIGLAEIGNQVICTDIDTTKIKSLQCGRLPIYEPGLKEALIKNVNAGRLSFTDDVPAALQKSNVLFIAVGTPAKEDGQADLSALFSVAMTIAKNLKSDTVICIKSTVPIGTGKILHEYIKAHADTDRFMIVSNPEFLREGTALYDFLHPDRIVIGTNSDEARLIMQKVYHGFDPALFLFTDIITAEIVKYAANSFLATKVSFINEIARLCDALGANIDNVAKGIGMDKRIGCCFLRPGPGFGGSCFPKDTVQFLCTATQYGIKLKIVRAALKANQEQQDWIVGKICRLLENGLQGKTIAILGIAFKSNTDDVRCSPSLSIINRLLLAGACIKAYDPAAISNARALLPSIAYCDSLYEAVTEADLAVILTEWREFEMMDLVRVRALMKSAIIFDTRNILSLEKLDHLGFKYDAIGRSRKLS